MLNQPQKNTKHDKNKILDDIEQKNREMLLQQQQYELETQENKNKQEILKEQEDELKEELKTFEVVDKKTKKKRKLKIIEDDEEQKKGQILNNVRNEVVRQRGQTLEALQNNILNNVRDTRDDTIVNLRDSILVNVRDRNIQNIEDETNEMIANQMGGRPLSVDRRLIYGFLNRPYRTGANNPNDVLFSDFEGESLNNFPENIRQELEETIEQFKKYKPRPTTSKLTSRQIKEINSIIKKNKK